MRKYLSKFLILPIILISFGVFQAEQVQAGGNFYLAPGALTVANGQTFSVNVRVNASSSVDAAQANLSYPTDKLDYLGVGYGGSAFEIQGESSGGGGSVKMGRATLAAKGGDLLVGTVTFRAKVASGSGVVSFTSGTEALKAGSVVVSAKSSGTYNFVKPAPVPKPDKTAPKISSVKVTGVGLNTATITWKTNESATSVVEYGLTKKLGISVSNTKLKKSHKLALSKKVLIAGTQIFYKVSSKDKAGNSASSKLTSFKTKGYDIRLKILNNRDEPIKEVTVTLVPGFETGKTDEQGIKKFDDVAPGKHSVNVDLGDGVLASEIDVLEKNPDSVQEFVIKLSSSGVGGSGGAVGIIPIIIIFALSVLVVIFAWIIKRKNKVIKKDQPPQKPSGKNSSNKKPPKDEKPAPKSAPKPVKSELPDLAAPDKEEAKPVPSPVKEEKPTPKPTETKPKEEIKPASKSPKTEVLPPPPKLPSAPSKDEASPDTPKGGIKQTKTIIPTEEISKDGKKIKVVRAEDY